MIHDEEDPPVRMTPAEIGVMRQIIAWRKANRVDFVRRDVLGMYWEAPYDLKRRGRDEVAYDNKMTAALGISMRRGWSDNYKWYEVASFTQAVDLLVAFGLLPARFSTAYRAGWDAAYEADQLAWEDAVPPAHPLVRGVQARDTTAGEIQQMENGLIPAEDLIQVAEFVHDRWYSSRPIDWEDFVYRLEELTGYDLGKSLDSPLIRRIKKHIHNHRKLG